MVEWVLSDSENYFKKKYVNSKKSKLTQHTQVCCITECWSFWSFRWIDPFAGKHEWCCDGDLSPAFAESRSFLRCFLSSSTFETGTVGKKDHQDVMTSRGSCARIPGFSSVQTGFQSEILWDTNPCAFVGQLSRLMQNLQMPRSPLQSHPQVILLFPSNPNPLCLRLCLLSRPLYIFRMLRTFV